MDDLWSGLQPGGKQSESDQSAGCFYTRTTGIWQPVWLEAVGSSFVESLSVVPDPDHSRVLITAKINGSDPDLKQKLHDITARQAAYERGEPMAGPPAVKVLDAQWQVLIGAAQDGKRSTPYKYVTDKPADDWLKAGFDDQAWKTGLAPFGNGNGTRTAWKTPDIYFRKTFEYAGGTLKNGAVVIRHNDKTEIYINGQKILDVTGSKGYYLCLVTEALQRALKPGANTIAVHSHEGGRGQWIDLALLVD